MLKRSLAAVVAALITASCQPAHASYMIERDAKCLEAFRQMYGVVGEQRALDGYERCVLREA